MSNRIIQVSSPEKEVSISDWKEVISRNFPEYLFPAKVGLSVVAQLLINDVMNPFALVLVDVPSAGKTITLNFFTGIKELFYPTDKITAQSFVSHSANVKKEKLAEIDLLPRIQHKALIVRELGTIFGQSEEYLTGFFSTFIRVLDGEGLESDSGVHGKRGYQGDYSFMMLGGCTPLQPRIWKVMGNLGSRLFFFNMNSPTDTEDDLVKQLESDSWKKREVECRDITSDFIRTLWSRYPNGIDWDKANDSREVKHIIARCAMLLASLRGVINVWSESDSDGQKYDHTEPVIEKPRRINQLLYNLARGHALVNGRNKVELDDLKPVITVVLNSAPRIRATIFDALIKNGGSIITEQAEQTAKCSKTTASKEMEKLKILGIGDLSAEGGDVGRPDKTLTLKADYQWFLSNECKQILGLEVQEPSEIDVKDLPF